MKFNITESKNHNEYQSDLIKISGSKQSFEESNLTKNQLLFFMGQQMHPNMPLYNMVISTTIYSSIDVDAFRKAFQVLIDKNDALRTVFHVHDGVPKKFVLDCLPYEVNYIDLSKHSDRQEILNAEIDIRNRKMFDFSECLFESTLFKISEMEYVWYWNQHHLICDAWSTALVCKRMSELYQYAIDGNLDAAPEYPKYEEYVKRERTYRLSEAYHKSSDYWDRILAQPLEPLTLYGRLPSRGSVEVERVSVQLGVERTRLLKALASQRPFTSITPHFSLFTVFSAFVIAYLYRVSGNSLISLGTPIHNRDSLLDKHTIGMFMEVAPLRVEVSEDDTFESLIKKVQSNAMGMIQHYRFATGNSLNRPAYHMVLNYHNATFTSFAGKPKVTHWLHPGKWEARDPLSMQIHDFDEKGDITVAFDFNCGIFEKKLRKRAISHFLNLIDGIISDPGRKIPSLNILTSTEFNRIVYQWNNTSKKYPSKSSIIDRFEEQVRQTPNSIALIFEGNQLSYDELNCKANQLGHYMMAKGVGPESVVGICMERSFELIIAIYGILKAGGAYLPIDTDYPQERINFILEDADIQVLLTLQGQKEKFSKWNHIKTVSVDTEWFKIANQDKNNPSRQVDQNNLAYVIYTSGSTGNPKGVMNEQKGILNRLHWMQEEYSLKANDKVLQKTPYNFDVSVWEFFWPLLFGAQLVIAKPGGHRDNAYLVNLIKTEGITTIHFVPAMLQNFIEERDVDNCTSLKRVICSGEALSFGLQELFFSRLNAELHNLYGPTEAAIDVTSWKCDPESDLDIVPIGKPISNTQLYILDNQMCPVPIGVPGELYIGGIQVARGYLNRSQLTSERFVEDPFAQDEGMRLYKTGDLVKYLEDGNISYIGRTDFQVKILGVRIELGEIESLLKAHKLVKEGVVVARETPQNEKKLVAFIIIQDKVNGQNVEGILRKHLGTKLPSYMVPSFFELIDSLPLTPNGKIDRKALIFNFKNGFEEDHYIAPRTEIDQLLSVIWADVLGLEKVGIDKNFFGLGGQSILATKLTSRILELFGVELPLRTIFEKPTIAELGELIDKLLLDKSGFESPVIKPASNHTHIPLSIVQQEIWFVSQLVQGNDPMNLTFTANIERMEDIDILEESMNEIVRRHDVLRTNFKIVNDLPAQIVNEYSRFKLQVINLKHTTEEEREWKSNHIIKEASLTPFDLQNDTLWRAKILKLSEEKSLLLFSMHHIITDAWSINIIFQELYTVYKAFSQGLPSPLPDLHVQYADYAVWQRQWFQGKLKEKYLTYWKEQLSGELPVLKLPIKEGKSKDGHYIKFNLSGEIYKEIVSLSQRNNVSVYMVFLAAYQILLHHYSGLKDIVVGSPISARTQKSLEQSIGSFINTIILRADLTGNPTFEDLLPCIRDNILGAYSHPVVPYEDILRDVQRERGLSITSLFQTIFVFQNYGEISLGFKEFEMKHVASEVEPITDLDLYLFEQEDGLDGLLNFKKRLYDNTAMSRFVEHYKKLIQCIVENPSIKISDYTFIAKSELQLLKEWNETEAEILKNICVHHLFEQQVLKTPGREALAFSGEKMTYKALNERSNQLAHYILSKDIDTNATVGICMDRSMELIIAILGVLKAGCSYVPIDPDYPETRVKFIFQDSNASLIITRKTLGFKLNSESIARINIDADWQNIGLQSKVNPNVKIDPDSLAYIIYTSGSTGTPKGVMIEHHSVVNYISAAIENFDLRINDSVLQFASISFDTAVEEIFPILSVGGKLVLRTDEFLSNELASIEACRIKGITVLDLPTAFWSQMTLALEKANINLPESLRLVIIGGEKVHASSIHCWNKLTSVQNHKIRLFNTYGPTEATVVSTMSDLTNFDNKNFEVPIGKPVKNTQVHILDKYLNILPVGVSGELCISGEGLARGYINRSDLTAEKFVHREINGKLTRLYRTGDLARWREDGQLIYLERADFQVKIRGFRVEPGEIEHVISRCEAVQENIVEVRQDASGNDILVAFIVFKEGELLNKEELISYLKSKLPHYMIPGAFIDIPKMPLNQNGKVDRKALLFNKELTSDDKEFKGPSTNTEKQLSEIWADVLAIKRVSVNSNFFELGGHSLLAVKISSQIQHTWNIQVPVITIFNQPTIEKLAGYIDTHCRQPVANNSIKRASREDFILKRSH